MKIPQIKGIIKRRILVNYRAEASVIQKILPAGMRPKLFEGKAIAGICLIRTEKIRPKGFPSMFGVASENAAHRIAVEWDENGGKKEGGFIARRDTDSIINSLLGGKLFPGEHHKAEFDIAERNGELTFSMISDDADVSISFSGELAQKLPENSVFPTLQTASDFFEAGSLGYSARKGSSDLDGLSLKISGWKVQPFDLKFVHSSFFDDLDIFPRDSVKFDHALFMENTHHEWLSAPDFNSNP